jgi:GntR family transcriptional regulator, transcriptional repressor for pyruvate dehydrogenase complex
MTRQAPSSTPTRDASQRSKLLQPLGPSRSLSEEITDRLAEQIISGALPAGAKLPSEQEMMTGMGVSRTVVREAVAALRARGLVITRHGVGAFVDLDTSRRPYVIDPEGLGSLNSVLEVLELRMAVESEAAAIASERATGVQIKAIREAQRVLGRAIADGERAVKEDFAFHLAIAAATQNHRFVDFLEFFGRLIIPEHSFDRRQRRRPAQLSQSDREGARSDLPGDRRPFAEKSEGCHAPASVEQPRALPRTRLRQADRLERFRPD